MKPPEGRRKRATIKDVAEHAGVSVSTVSYVLNDSGPVGADRRGRILDAVRLLEYSPNQSARSLKRHTVSTIGMVVPELSNSFFAMVVEGVERAATEQDVLVVLVVPEATAAGEERRTRLMRSQRVDGVIYLTGTGYIPGSVYELARSGPVVLIDEQIAGMDLPAVVCDSRRGGREIASHVLAQGHRDVAVIGGPPALWTAGQRLAGYREAFASAGAVEHCREEGIRVPEDLSIVGFDDLPVAAMLTPRLTTVRQPAHDIGYRAASLLFDIFEDRAPQTAVEVLPVTLQARESVAPPRTR